MVCPRCGGEIQENARFCKHCGNRIGASVPVDSVRSNTAAIQSVWPEWQMEEKPLGKGSYGVVYKAVRRDHNVESVSAIKVITIPADPAEVDSMRSEGMDDNATRTYFQRVVDNCVSEIQLMVSLKGTQNVVSVEDYKVVELTDEIGWKVYIRMELLTPFNNYLCSRKMTEDDVIKLGCDICSALEMCDRRNIIHRDIKPENIFVNEFGYFKLGDFGIARKMENMTGGLSQKGTFSYMAPEVAASGEYDARADIYSLGLVLYRLLNANHLPFLESEQQLLNPNERHNAVERRLHGEVLPLPCEASPAMAEVILTACAFDPDDRFASATAMKRALLRVAEMKKDESNLDATVSVRKAPVDDYDKTTAVRKAPADDYDRTTAVRKSPAEPPHRAEKNVNTFGTTPKKNNGLMIVLISMALIVLLLLGVTIYLLSDNGKQEEQEASRPQAAEKIDSSIMPYFVNEEISVVEEQLREMGIEREILYEFHDTYAENRVISQSIAAGTELQGNEFLTLTVSKGSDVCPYDYSQKLVVSSSRNSSYATASLYEWNEGDWQLVTSYNATVGSNGIGQAYEGSKRTPKGLFKLGIVLTARSLNTNMDTYYVTSTTCVVDDPDSRYYNCIMDRSQIPSGTSYDMIGKGLNNGTSNAFIYIEHNGTGLSSDGVVAGAGSVMGVRGTYQQLSPTFGDVHISASDMLDLLSKLDSAKNPMIELTTN